MFRDHTLTCLDFFCTYSIYYCYYWTCGKQWQSIKEHVEHVDPSFIVFDSETGPLEFLLATLPLTPHQIGIGQDITLITNTPHALEVFMTPIVTFEETLDRQKIFAMPTSFHIMN
jgi:hypothetical protein